MQQPDLRTIDDYFREFGHHHIQKVTSILEPLHVPGEHPLPGFEYVPEGRKPFDAQAHVVAATIRMLDEARNGLIVGECGVGKSIIGALAFHEHASRSVRKGGSNGRYRAIVLCPDHLVGKWKEELELTLPGVKVYLFDSEGVGLKQLLGDMLRLRDEMRAGHGRWKKPEGAEWFILGRNQAKFFPVRSTLGNPRKSFDGKIREHGSSRKHLNRFKTMKAGKEVTVSEVSRIYRCPSCGKPVTNNNDAPVDVAEHDKLLHCTGTFIREVAEEGRKMCGLDRSCYLKGTYAKLKVGQLFEEGGRKWKVYACNERLWQFTAKPKRWPPGAFLSKHMAGAFRYLIVDEIHEQKSDVTARATACGKLMASVRYCLGLTGTLIGGYANHLFPLLMRMQARPLRDEGFEWGHDMPFTQQYGRVERIVTTRTDPKGRTSISTRTASMKKDKKEDQQKRAAPGIMPALFGRHLIDKAIFLALEDVAANLPPITEYVGGEEDDGDDPFWIDCKIEMAKEQHDEYMRVEEILVDECREQLQFGSRKLLGAMLHTLLGYPDHPWGWVPPPDLNGQYKPDQPPMAVGYWEVPNLKLLSNWKGVVQPADLDKDVVYPKEKALLDICTREVRAGNQVWVYCQMTDKRDVQPRLKELLSECGFNVAIMRSKAVDTRDRLDWIDREGRKANVIISHPQLVETGLDFFSKKKGGHNFNSIVFYETGYNLFTLRQAARRAWRIGQVRPCRVYYLHYAGTMQWEAMKLMARKMAAAQALDGELNLEGLTAMADDQSAAMALARSISNAMDDTDVQRTWTKLGQRRPVVPQPMIEMGLKDIEECPIDGIDLLSMDAQLIAQTLLNRGSGPSLSREQLAFMFGDLFGLDASELAAISAM